MRTINGELLPAQAIKLVNGELYGAERKTQNDNNNENRIFWNGPDPFTFILKW